MTVQNLMRQLMSINGETFLAGSSRLRCALRMSDFRKRLLQKTKKCTLCLNPAHYTPIFATYAQRTAFLTENEHAETTY